MDQQRRQTIKWIWRMTPFTAGLRAFKLTLFTLSGVQSAAKTKLTFMLPAGPDGHGKGGTHVYWLFSFLTACWLFFQSNSKLLSPTNSLTLVGIFACLVSISVLLLLWANSLHPERRRQEKEVQETEEWNFNSLSKQVHNIGCALMSPYVGYSISTG